MTKNYYMLLLAFFTALWTYAQVPIITHVVDACGSDGKFVEIYVSGTLDFAEYKLVRRSNSGTWAENGVDIDLTSLGSRTDEFVYVGRDIATLTAEFPSAAISASNAIENTNISHNGNDSYRLVQIDGDVVIDQFGGDTNGEGEPWEYEDAWGSRNNEVEPNPTFTLSEWTFGAIDSLDSAGLCNGESVLEETVTAVGNYMPPATASGPDSAPPLPTQDQEDVVSVYGDEYTGSTSFTPTTFGVEGNNSTGEFLTFAENEVFKITYDGGDFIGLEFDEPIDASAMDVFHLDVWIENPVPIGAVFILKWSNHAGGHLTGETDTFVTTRPVAPDQGGQWISLDIPLTSEGFPNESGDGLDARSILSQLVINSASSEGTFGPFYYDNLYFWAEPCPTEDIPFLEDFESDLCGTITNEGSGAQQWAVVDVNSFGFTPNHLRYRWDSANAANSWYFTQGINLTAGENYEITYDYGGTGTSFPEKLRVAYGTGNTSADMVNELANYPEVISNAPVTDSRIFTPDATGVYHFGFQVYSDADQFYLHLDNVAVDLAPTCPAPTDIMTSNLSSSSVDLSWTAGGSETEWEVLYGEEGFDPATDGTLVNDDDGVLGVTLTGLDGQTSYDAYVRAICSDTDISEWTLINFTTTIAPVIVEPGVVESEAYCYVDSDFKEWLFESSDGSPLVIEFQQGSVEAFGSGTATFDDLIIYDGQNDTGAVLFNSDEEVGVATDLTGLILIAESGFMYITLDSDGSVSCDDPGLSDPPPIQIQFEVSVLDLPTANVQVIHNSPDPGAEFVDVYINNELVLDDFEFRTATPFVELPAGTPVSIDIAGADSGVLGDVLDPADSLYNLAPTLVEGENYLLVANGVLDPSAFITDNAFELTVYTGANTVADDPAGVDVLVHHGSPDAPAVDVNEPDAGNLVSNISYPEFQGYLPLPVADYVLEVAAAGTPDALVAYQAPLATLGGFEGAAITVLASGFFGEDAGDGNAFGLWVASAAGGPLLELPLVEESAYCIPVEFPNGCDEDNIDSFEIPGADFSHLETGCSEGTYGDFTADESLEIDLSQTVIYDFSITHNYNSQFVKIWVDFNLDNVFDESEVLFSGGPSGGTVAAPEPTFGTITVPSTVSVGTTRMRVITRFNNEPVDPCDPTGSNGEDVAWGEVHDYTVNILEAPACTQPTNVVADNLLANSVDLTWTPGGSETEWEVLWGETGFDPLTEGTLVSDDDGVLGVTLTTLSPDTTYDVYVRAVCSETEVSAWTLFTFETPIETVIVNSGVVEEDDYCYVNDDFKEWSYASFDGSPLVIEFLQGSVETNFGNTATFDDLIIYDGQDDTGVVLFNSDDEAVTANDLTGLTLVAESGFLYVTLTTDGSVSCSEGDEIQIIFEVSIQSVGTTQFDTSNFGFYPNPVNDQINFETLGQVEEVRIYNIQGRQVMLETPNAVSPKLSVNNLQTGTYIMSVTIDGASKNFKLIKR